jgi:three-Cys-motif partner protein
MSSQISEYDIIGTWSLDKLNILRQYAEHYSNIVTSQGFFTSIYIDAFAGRGEHISKDTGELILGSPLNALNIKNPFKEYHFIDVDRKKVAHLRNIVGDREDVFFYDRDCHEVLLNEVYPRAKWKDYKRALCFLDPYKLQLRWEIVEQAGKANSIEIWLNFPIHHMNRNVLRKDPSSVTPHEAARMNEFWGDESWYEAAYPRQANLLGLDLKEPGNDPIVRAYQKRLKDVAGFRYVPEPIPMKHPNGAIIYYLFFAGPNETGARIAKYIMNQYKRP